jgi:ribosome-associated translation inhibitor RaiA
MDRGMKIQVNTDHNIEGDERLAEFVKDVVEDALSRFRERITRVEVHLGDVNAGKPGDDDKRCMIEARLAGRHPTAVTHHASTVRDAVAGATDKIERALDRELGKQGR